MMPYPGMFLQDLIGPLTMFEALLNRDIFLVWKDTSPMKVGSSITLTPTTTFDQCPSDVDVLFVPGGVPGTFAMMEDAEVLAFLASRGRTAKYRDECLHRGPDTRRGRTAEGIQSHVRHWNTREILSVFGAIPTEGRVVVDRNRITGGGVTAGLDFGLRVIAELRSQAYAEAVQLYVEYDPQPPFRAGSPKTAPKEAKAFVDDMLGSVVAVARETAERAQSRLGR